MQKLVIFFVIFSLPYFAIFQLTLLRLGAPLGSAGSPMFSLRSEPIRAPNLSKVSWEIAKYGSEQIIKLFALRESRRGTWRQALRGLEAQKLSGYAI